MDTAEQGLLSRDEMESRRLLAAQDLQTGLSQSQVARKFGVSRTTASRWNRTLSGKGVESLRKRRAPGRPSRLTADQRKTLTDTYQAGPRAAGFETDRWTPASVAVRRASCRMCCTRSRLSRWIFPKFRQTWRKAKWDGPSFCVVCQPRALVRHDRPQKAMACPTLRPPA